MKKLLLAAVALSAISTSAHAVTFAGSWQVDAGQNWTTVPAAFTGQEAAALLFGGVASDYAISTIDATIANIDNMAWVSTWGGACGGSYPCGTKVAENYEVSTGGLYANYGDTSAYVQDWAIGSQYTNYAFRIDGAVPEPATWGMMLLGFGLVGAAMRRKQSAQVRFAF